MVEQLLLLAESDPRYAALQCSVAGFVFDSAPVFVQPGGIERVIATTEPPGLRRWVRTKYFSLAASWVGWGEFFEDMRRLSWGRPLLFLYSADDPLCDGAKVGTEGWEMVWHAGRARPHVCLLPLPGFNVCRCLPMVLPHLPAFKRRCLSWWRRSGGGGTMCGHAAGSALRTWPTLGTTPKSGCRFCALALALSAT